MPGKFPFLPIAQDENSQREIIVLRLIALWGVCESALGGILHALKIPFSGLVLSGIAALIISMIAITSKKKGTILRATLFVLIIKFTISPHSPLSAYLAVFIQGLLGELIFFPRRFYVISVALLVFLSELLSSVQKLLIMTIVFGMDLWRSIDLFVKSIIELIVGKSNTGDFSASTIIVSLYLILHLLAAIIFSIIGFRLPRIIAGLSQMKLETNIDNGKEKETENESPQTKQKKKLWFQRTTGKILIGGTILLFISSYFIPANKSFAAYNLPIMIIRACSITILWFMVIGPLILKFVQRYFKKKQLREQSTLVTIMQLMPDTKKLLLSALKASSSESRLTRIKIGIKMILYSVFYLPQRGEDSVSCDK